MIYANKTTPRGKRDREKKKKTLTQMGESIHADKSGSQRPNVYVITTLKKHIHT